jgi:hypothetical protein
VEAIMRATPVLLGCLLVGLSHCGGNTTADTGPTDTGPGGDSGQQNDARTDTSTDTVGHDTGGVDTGAHDTGGVDTGGADTSVPDAGPLTMAQQIARECVFEQGCNSGFGSSTTVSDCIQLMLTQPDMPLGSAATRGVSDKTLATTCAQNNCTDWQRCQNLGHDAAYCTAHPAMDTCDGNIAVSCGTTRVISAQDCTAKGGTCRVVGGFAGCYASGSCTTSPYPQCSGNLVIDCSQGMPRIVSNCAVGGWMCATGTVQTIQMEGACVPPGMNSCGGASTSCSGTSVVDCVSVPFGPETTQWDCAAQGRVCQMAGSLAVCTASNSSCSLSADTCNGNSLTLCVDGMPVTQDCRALGFVGCLPADATHVASCSN